MHKKFTSLMSVLSSSCISLYCSSVNCMVAVLALYYGYVQREIQFTAVKNRQSQSDGQPRYICVRA